MPARTLLLVDDDPGVLNSLRWSFDDCGILTAIDRNSALREVRDHRPAVVTLDLGLPPVPDDVGEGMRALEEILMIAPETKVVVVTGDDQRPNAVKAIGLGAYDFYQKPIDAGILRLIVDRAFNVAELEAENRRLQKAPDTSFFGLITNSSKMFGICRMIEKIAPADFSVLLLGDSGTGKELMARAVHRLSPRREGPFIAINCAAIPDALLESELFGHEKGAFTGAVRQTKGKIELASRGTLFLDEIGDMPMALQAKLLRFIQERVIERVGGREPITVDVRIVSATHRKLDDRIVQGEFREDLFYRLSEITIQIPPLRERDDDVILLARHFVDACCRKQGLRRLDLAPDALVALRQHAWPGNVRELENRIKRAVILAEGGTLTATDMDLKVPEAAVAAAVGTFSLRRAREEAEREALLHALADAAGNLSAAAKLLGVSRPTIYNLLRQHNVRP